LHPSKPGSRKIRALSEAFIGEQYLIKRAKSRIRDQRSESKLRERRNRSAELFRKSEGEGSFASFEQSEAKAGQFVS